MKKFNKLTKIHNTVVPCCDSSICKNKSLTADGLGWILKGNAKSLLDKARDRSIRGRRRGRSRGHRRDRSRGPRNRGVGK